MKNISCKLKRITALLLMLLMLLPSAPALAESSYSAAVTDDVAAYADASLTRKVGDLERYDVVTVTGIKGDVARIRYSGYTLYTDLDALVAVKDFATAATVRQASRVYEYPDTASKNLALKQGVQVYILATSGDWAMIERGGNVGYTDLSCLQTAAAGTQDDEEDPFLPDGEDSKPSGDLEGSETTQITGGNSVTIETVEAVVSSATMPVYASASTSSKKLGTLKAGQEVTIYAYNASWAYIGLNGRFGFCALQSLSKKAAAAEPVDPNPFDPSTAVPAIVTASSVKVYQSASTSSKKLGTLKRGAEVNLLKTASGWAYIELNGNYGYCSASAIARKDDANNNNNNGGDSGAMGTCTVIVPSAKAYASKSTSAASTNLTMGDTVSFYNYDSKWVQVAVNGKTCYMLRQDLNADSYAELKNEDSGDGVKSLENALLALGYLDSVPGSNFSSDTVTALKRLQSACGMEQSGIANVATLRVLYSGNAPICPLLSANLTSGSTGEHVTRLQNRLLALGYLSMNSSVDGDYGSKTSAAVKLFQTAAGGSATGVADSKTLRALYSASAPKLPSASKPADAQTSSSGNSNGMPDGLGSNTDKYISGMSNAQKLEYVIYVAQQQLGKRYVFGATGTKTFDCSGLTLYCFKQVGVTLKRTAYAEGYNDARKKISSISGLRRGDLVFFNTVSDGDLCDHTGIYLGSSKFIHASSGAGKVVVSDLSGGYYNRKFSWGRRVLDA